MGSLGERRWTPRAASATRALPYAPHHSPPPPNPYPATAWRRRCRGAVAHRRFSAVSSPSCEGKLPLRSLFLRSLREGRRSGIMGEHGDGRRGRQVRRARFPYAPLPSVPSHALPCHGLEAGVPRCGGSQARQRGEKPKLRGQAAAQVVVAKGPARGAPERDHGGMVMDAGGSKCDTRASPSRRHPPCPPTPYPATAWRPRCGGSQDLQRGEKPELRGYAAAQAVAVKAPARGAPEQMDE